MPNTIFQQGEARIVPISIVEQGTPVDMTLAVGITAIAKINGVETSIKYSLVLLGGYGILTVGAPINQLNMEMTRQQTKQLPAGALSFCVTARFPDVNFTSGFREEIYDVTAGYIETGCGLNENP